MAISQKPQTQEDLLEILRQIGLDFENRVIITYKEDRVNRFLDDGWLINSITPSSERGLNDRIPTFCFHLIRVKVDTSTES